MSDEKLYNLIKDDIEAIIDQELGEKKQITKADIKVIVKKVLLKCGFSLDATDFSIKREGIVDIYHRGLFVATRDADAEGVHLYPLRPGQQVDILTDEGWQTVDVESNPAAKDDPQALRVKLAVDDETPVIGVLARRAALLDMQHKNLLESGKIKKSETEHEQ